MFSRTLKLILISASLAGFLIGCGDGSGVPIADPGTPPAPTSPTTPGDPSKTPPPPVDPAVETAHIEYGTLTGTGADSVKKEWDLLMTDGEGKPLSIADITSDRDKIGLFFTFVFKTYPALPPLEIIKKEVRGAQFKYGLAVYAPKGSIMEFEKALDVLGAYQEGIKKEILKVAKIYKVKLRDFDLVADKGGIIKSYNEDAVSFVNSVMSPLITKFVGSASLGIVRDHAYGLLENVTLIFQKKDGSEDLVSFATFADPKPPPSEWSVIYSFEDVFGKNCGGFTSLPPSAVNF